MEDIAEAAGVVRQTVYAHYPSRKALLAAVLQQMTTQVVATLDGLDLRDGPAPRALRRWLDACWDHPAGPDGVRNRGTRVFGMPDSAT